MSEDISSRNHILRSGNRLKLGLFGANVSSGAQDSNPAEHWDPTWANNLRVAQIADDAGLETMVPIARWRGFGGESNPNHVSWETITWAAGLLAATKSINIFATIHVPLFHPVTAAKQLVTVDHIGQGRLGVNVVGGWNQDEFRMFGMTQREHDLRYDQAVEWWDIVTRIWSSDTEFDFDGAYYQLQNVEGAPRPFGLTRPIMMNAGASPAGREFAQQYADLHFDAVRNPLESADRIAESKRLAAANGHDLQVWTPIGVVCRPTQQEAVEFTDQLVEDSRRRSTAQFSSIVDVQRRVAAMYGAWEIPTQLARGGPCPVGDPDHVAAEIAKLANVGYDGLALNFVNFADELPFFVQEVLPRLEAMGLRSAFRPG